MKTVKINGFEYQYINGQLFLDGSIIDKKHLTFNEKQQLETWVKYNGIPMYSF